MGKLGPLSLSLTKARWGRVGGLGGEGSRERLFSLRCEKAGPPVQAVTERRPVGPCPLRRRKLRASTAERDRKAARRAVSVATKEATGIDSRARGSPSSQTIMDSVSRPCYSAVCPSFSRLTATASPCAPPPAMRASSAWRAWASSRVQSVKVLLPRTCLLT